MSLSILYFASLREELGQEREELATCPEGVATVGELRLWLAARGGAWAQALAPNRAVRAARNHDLARADTRLAEGDEIAFFPPVTGG